MAAEGVRKYNIKLQRCEFVQTSDNSVLVCYNNKRIDCVAASSERICTASIV